MTDESYYKDRGEERNWPRIVLIVLGMIILALITFLIVKGCTDNNKNVDVEQGLLEAGKTYYDSDITLLPQASGECEFVTLGKLIEEGLITQTETYNTCDNNETYVKVCKLQSGSYHYLPVLKCENNVTSFTDWKEGTESNLIADKSDVKFIFKGEYQKNEDTNSIKEETAWLDELTGINYQTISSTKYYRYRDLVWKWQVNKKLYYSKDGTEYFASAPNSEYTSSEGQTTGYKWYTLVSTGKQEWQKTSDPTKVEATVLNYICHNGEYSTTKCGEGFISLPGPNNGYYCVGLNSEYGSYKQPCSTKGDDWVEYGRQYTCNGTDIVDKGTVCALTCPTGTALNEDKTACGQLVDVKTKKYYSSGSSNVNDEKNYYVTAPVKDAIKDETTATKVSKYIKITPVTTDKYYSTSPGEGYSKVGEGIWGSWTNYQTAKPKEYANTRQIETRTKVVFKRINDTNNLNNWVAISDEYLTEKALITKFQTLGYKVNTLEDIEKVNDLRYQIKLEYRNRD